MNKKLFLVIPFVLLTIGCNNKPKDNPIPIVKDKYFTVTWTDYNGTVLEVDENVEKGTMPEYNGELPTREPTAQYAFTFKSWSPELSPVDRNITYMATYSTTVNTYTVTWKNYDGEVLLVQNDVPYGTEPYFEGEQPDKEPTERYVYYFNSWQPEVSKIISDIEFTATYDEIVRHYRITWLNWNDSLLKIGSTAYGSIPVYDGIRPTKPADEQYTYEFAGWSPELVECTGSATYKAQYTAVPIE